MERNILFVLCVFLWTGVMAQEPKISRITEDKWDEAQQAWKLNKLTEYAYDSDFRMTDIVEYELTQTEQGFNLLSTTELVYKGDNLSTKTYYQYEDGQATNGLQIEYSYKSGNLLDERQFVLKSNDWKPHYRVFYKYGSNGKVSEYVSQKFNEATGEFGGTDFDTRELWVYDGMDRVQSHYENKYDVISSSFFDYNLYEYIYNGMNKVDEELYKRWKGNEYRNLVRTTWSYASINDTIQMLSEIYDDNLNTWSNSYRKLYTNFNDSTTVNVDVWDDVFGWQPGNRILYKYRQGVLIEEIHQMHDNGAWKNLARFRYSYINLPTTVAKAEQSVIEIFPNPAREFTTIRLTEDLGDAITLQVLDYSGRTVSQRNLAEAAIHGTVVDLKEIPAGSYTVRLAGSLKEVQRKLIVME